MTDLKKGEAPDDLVDEVVKGLMEAKNFFDKMPFDGIPGGLLKYPKKKKDDDNDDGN